MFKIECIDNFLVISYDLPRLLNGVKSFKFRRVGTMDKPAPIYSQIYEHFSEQIRQDRIRTGERLPTEAEIAERFRVSRATVQFAMSRLAWEGWIERFPGRGTFANTKPVRSDGPPSRYPDFKINMHSLPVFTDETVRTDDDITYRLMTFGRKKPPCDISKMLSIEKGQLVFVLERLRFIGENAVEAESCFFPPDVFPKFETTALDKAPTEELLVEENLGFKIGRVETTIEPANADSSEAQLLNPEGDRALLWLLQKHFSEDDKPIVYAGRVCVSPIGFSYRTQAV